MAAAGGVEPGLSTHNRHTPRRIGRPKLDVRTVEMRVVRFYRLEGGERSSALVGLGANLCAASSAPTASQRHFVNAP
jgi:hypothetical protein